MFLQNKILKKEQNKLTSLFIPGRSASFRFPFPKKKRKGNLNEAERPGINKLVSLFCSFFSILF